MGSADTLRDLLHGNDVLFSAEALEIALKLHTDFVDLGLMWDFIPHKKDFAAWELEASQRILGENAKNSLQIVEMNGSDLKIPVFTSFLKRVTKECQVCFDDVEEVVFESIEHWKQACQTGKVEGPWMWKILGFATSDTLGICDHEHEICRKCVSEHIDTQLTQLGPQGYHLMPCYGCPRVLADTEIRSYCTPEMLER